MLRYILAGILCGVLGLYGFPVLAEQPSPSEEQLAKPQTQVKQEPPPMTFEQRLDLEPLSDEELGEITAAGVGPVTYMLPTYLFNHNLLQPHLASNQITTGDLRVSSQSSRGISQTNGNVFLSFR